MIKKILLIVCVLFSSVSFSVFDDDDIPSESKPTKGKYELSVCLVDTKSKNNLTYYHLPSINTKLVCDVSHKKVRTGTFEAFYNDGWRLIQVANVDSRLQTNKKSVPYSIIYLERRR